MLLRMLPHHMIKRIVSLEQKWPQLLQITLALSSNNDSSMRETDLYLLAQIGEYAPEFYSVVSNIYLAHYRTYLKLLLQIIMR